jgi:hypothetical protein
LNTRWDDKEKRPQLDGYDLFLILLPGFSGMVIGLVLDSFVILLAGLIGSAIVNIVKILKLRSKNHL